MRPIHPFPAFLLAVILSPVLILFSFQEEKKKTESLEDPPAHFFDYSTDTEHLSQHLAVKGRAVCYCSDSPLPIRRCSDRLLAATERIRGCCTRLSSEYTKYEFYDYRVCLIDTEKAEYSICDLVPAIMEAEEEGWTPAEIRYGLCSFRREFRLSLRLCRQEEPSQTCRLLYDPEEETFFLDRTDERAEQESPEVLIIRYASGLKGDEEFWDSFPDMKSYCGSKDMIYQFLVPENSALQKQIEDL